MQITYTYKIGGKEVELMTYSYSGGLFVRKTDGTWQQISANTVLNSSRIGDTKYERRAMYRAFTR